ISRKTTRPLLFTPHIPDPRRCFPYEPSLPRTSRGVVVRTQETRLAPDVFHDLLLVPNVVARRQHVKARGQQFLHQPRRDSESGRRVLTVGDGQIDVLSLNDITDVVSHDAAARRAEDITDEEDAHGSQCRVTGGLPPVSYGPPALHPEGRRIACSLLPLRFEVAGSPAAGAGVRRQCAERPAPQRETNPPSGFGRLWCASCRPRNAPLPPYRPGRLHS